MLTPIETVYRGYKFRSRLEARWAVFLDALNEPWEYEKEGYRVKWFDEPEVYYLPDFWLPRLDSFLEIKGSPTTEQERTTCRALMSERYPVILAHGVPGENFLEVFICEMCENGGGFTTVQGQFVLHEEKDQIIVVLDRWNSSCSFCTSDDWTLLDRFWNNSDIRGTVNSEAKIIKKAINKSKQARFEYGAMEKI